MADPQDRASEASDERSPPDRGLERKQVDTGRGSDAAGDAEQAANPEAHAPEDTGSSATPARRGGGSRPSAGELTQRAREELSQITGLPAESVTSFERADDGTWRVAVELLEFARIPESEDLLGVYEAELDDDGQLLGFRRLERYSRAQAQAREQEQRGG